MGSENFGFSTALELLPVMNDEECVTRTLINGIDFYSSLLCDSAKKILINFVLKTRLSQVGKFYLNSQYNDVNEMLSDMKKHLLPRKSHTSLQFKMLNCKQSQSKSIKEFGQEIEHILVDLTYAQLDFLGNSEEENRKIIFPINEKTAIKCFCDGLSNYRLRLIMACRQPNSLCEAIQIAIEEEIMIENEKFRRDGRNFNKNMKSYKEHDYYNNQMHKEKNNYQFENNYSRKVCINQNKILNVKNNNELKKQTECHNISTELQIPQVQRNQTPEIQSSNDDVTHSLVPMYRNDVRTNNKVMKFKTNCKINENVSTDDRCNLSELPEESNSNTDCIEEECEKVDSSLCQLFKENNSNIDCVDEKCKKEIEKVAYIPCQLDRKDETLMTDFVKEESILTWKYRNKFREKG